MTYGNYPDLRNVKKALVIKLRHHGDVLLTSPIFSNLHRALPHCQVDALIYKDTLPMLEGHPGICEFHLYDRAWKQLPLWLKVSKEYSFLQTIRGKKYDLILNLTEGDRGALIAMLSQSQYRVGFDRKKIYTHLVKRGPHPRHTVEKHLDVLRRIGVFPALEDRDLFLHVPQEAKTHIELLLQQSNTEPGNYVLIHPTSRWRFKCLATEQIARLIISLHAKGEKIVLSSGPDPEELAMIDAISRQLSQVPFVNCAGILTLKELAALIQLSRALICVDSVPLHIASALKTPVVAVFGPTSELNWGPWMHHQARVVTQMLPCRPCYQDGCGGSKMSDCLFTLPVSKIVDAFEELMQPMPITKNKEVF